MVPSQYRNIIFTPNFKKTQKKKNAQKSDEKTCRRRAFVLRRYPTTYTKLYVVAGIYLPVTLWSLVGRSLPMLVIIPTLPEQDRTS